ncbi:hypothetical protein ACEQPO_01985 [Bacillus sp. SL00103]
MKKPVSSMSCIEDEIDICGVHIPRTGGQHGTGGLQSGWDRSAVLFSLTLDEPNLYIAGDTIWCDEPKEVINTASQMSLWSIAESSQFLEGDPITMTKEDILDVHRSHPTAQIVACHLEAVNHCLLTRASFTSLHSGASSRKSHFCS